MYYYRPQLQVPGKKERARSSGSSPAILYILRSSETISWAANSYKSFAHGIDGRAEATIYFEIYLGWRHF